jgi:bacterial/archaeal transporter family-2 protein
MAIYLILAILAGLLMPLQAALNAKISISTAHPLVGAWISFIVGAICLSVMMFFYEKSLSTKQLFSLPWWTFLGGIFGALFVTLATFVLPKIGALQLMISFLIGQVIMSLIMDHYRLLGSAHFPFSLPRLFGVICILIGFFLVGRR